MSTHPNNPIRAQVQRHRGLTATVFALCLALSGTLVWWLDTERVAAQRATTLALASDQAQSIESRIQRLMSATYLLAAMVRKDGGAVRQFEEVATEMLPFFPGVTSLALSPAGVISHAVPLDRNRSSIGFNQLADPLQSPEAFLARDTGQLTLAGPLQLAQGGLGAVGRLPIYLPDAKGHNSFWGFANVVLRFPEALSNSGLGGLPDLGYEYTLWRDKPGGERQVISASPNVLAGLGLAEPVNRSLKVPNGQWVLSVAPRNGWGSTTERGLQVLAAVLFSAVMALLARNALAHRDQRQLLEHMVNQRTHDIQGVQNQLQATLDAIPDLMFEIDLPGVLHRVHTLSPELLVMPPEQVQGRNISDLLPPEVCEVAQAAMAEAQTQGRSLGRQYTLTLPSGPHWFELSVATKHTDAGEAPRFLFLARDITSRKQAESDLLLAAKVFEQSSEAILITQPDQTIIKVNAAFTRITGYTQTMVVGQTPRVLSSGKHSRDFYTQMWEALLAHGQWQGEVWNRKRNGEIYPEWLSITRVADAQGQTTHFIAIFTDTSVRKAQEAKIRHLAYFDALTGLANRALLKDRVQHDLNQARRHKSPLTLLFIDLDHFKNINDSLGHQMGDSLLSQLAVRLQSSVRGQDTVARLGGDEFVALLPETDADGAAHMAQTLLDLIAQPYQLGDHELTVTPSIGIAMYPNDGEDFDTLYRCADTAMYMAKQAGRNSYCFFTPDMQAQSIRRLQLDNALRRALERQQFHLVYQPQVSIDNGSLVGVEVLLRWNHPDWGLVSPAEFIPVAESSGQILAIGDWVLRTATAQVKTWLDAGMPEMVLAVNLSALQLRQSRLPEQVAAVLADTGLPPHCLELELTESAAMDNPESAILTMNALRQNGVQMSVDDFGTGYSSLNYLKRFQVYKLKIDQGFVRDVITDPDDASIVRAIIQMAHSLGLKTIAEGVETQAQLDFLRAEGCDEVQGYLVARPLGPEALADWVRGRPPSLPAG